MSVTTQITYCKDNATFTQIKAYIDKALSTTIKLIGVNGITIGPEQAQNLHGNREWIIGLNGGSLFDAGSGLYFSGNTLNIGTASASRIVLNTDTIDLATTAVGAGTYGNVSNVSTFTVDSWGRITAATNTPIQIAQSQVTNLVSDLATKQGNLTLTTVGSSGVATLVTNTLNIPNYTLAGLGGEPIITAGTTAQYWRGDKTFQNLNAAVIASTLTGYTSGAGTITSADSVLSAIQKLNGNMASAGVWVRNSGIITPTTNTDIVQIGNPFSPVVAGSDFTLQVSRKLFIDATGTGQNAAVYQYSKVLSNAFGTGNHVVFGDYGPVTVGFGFNLGTAGDYQLWTYNNGWNKRFAVTEPGDLYAYSLASATTSNIIYYNSGTGRMTYGTAPAGITLTTTGTSGVATLVGTTLNIPNYGAGFVPYTGATQTVVLGNTYGMFSQFISLYAAASYTGSGIGSNNISLFFSNTGNGTGWVNRMESDNSLSWSNGTAPYTLRMSLSYAGNLTTVGSISATLASATTANVVYYDSSTKLFTYGAAPVGTGTVSSVSVVSANGFAGTVATATTTPAITISTTITGLLKGNGTAISAASVGTDYSLINGTGFVKATGTTLSYDNSTYLTTIAGITAGGELTGTYASPSLSNAAVIGKVLTGYVSGAGTITAADSILSAIQKLNGNITGAGFGSVTSVSVVTANGFAGTVATATTTPAITITTSITGLLKGNGTAISAAVSGTDYLLPSAVTFVGTTSIALNRTSAAQALTGITSIDGSAATLTTARTIQGVSFNGSANINIISGTGFVKSTGTTLSYDNSTYLTTTAAGTTYVPYTGATALVNIGSFQFKCGAIEMTGSTPSTTVAYTAPYYDFVNTANDQSCLIQMGATSEMIFFVYNASLGGQLKMMDINNIGQIKMYRINSASTTNVLNYDTSTKLVTYAPASGTGTSLTITNTTNYASYSGANMSWARSGNTVTVSYFFTVSSTAGGTDTEFILTLPITSSSAVAGGGSGVAQGGGILIPVYLVEYSLSQISVKYKSAYLSNTLSFTYTYPI